MKKPSKRTNPSKCPKTNQPRRPKKSKRSSNTQKKTDLPGPPSAWHLQIQEWHEEHYQVTVRQIFSRAGAAAEDLVHEAIARTAKCWGNFDSGITPFHNWLYGILKHCTFDYFRRNKTKEKNSDSYSYEVALKNSSDPALSGSDRVRCFQSVLRHVPPKNLELLLAFYGHDQSLKAVAQQFGASVGAIKMRLSRAMRALTAALHKAGYRCLDDVEKFGPTRLPLRLIAKSSAGSKPKLCRRATQKRRSKLLPGSALVRKTHEPKRTIKPK